MSQKVIHYNLDEIDKKGALINLIYGERSNGKSYQVKHKKGILNFLQGGVCYHSDYKTKEVIKDTIKKGTRFILLRRWREEISTSAKYASTLSVEISSRHLLSKINLVPFFIVSLITSLVL